MGFSELSVGERALVGGAGRGRGPWWWVDLPPWSSKRSGGVSPLPATALLRGSV